jgi:CubicO group peptidase (beta-lactamase class C family)
VIHPARGFALATALAVGCAAAAAACAGKVGRDLPVATPSEVGLSAAAWIDANQALDAGRHEVRALLVVRNCKLVFERYKDGLGREHSQAVYSMTKSVASTLVGALLHQGKLKSLDAPIADLAPRPERTTDANWQKARQISLRHAMQMASGLAFHNDPSVHPIYGEKIDRFAYALASPVEAAPGTRYHYSNGDASMTGAVIAAAAGEDLLAFGRRALFDPLDMANVHWLSRDRVGRYPGGWGLQLRPMDMAKLGQLYLQRGEWNGQRVFAASYRDEAWRAGPSAGYALYWWVGSSPHLRGAPYFYANGYKGQRIYVFPTHDAVVVLSASLPGGEDAIVMQIVVKALATSVARGADAPGRGTDAQLKTVASAGFRGELRIHQSAQDTPRL